MRLEKDFLEELNGIIRQLEVMRDFHPDVNVSAECCTAIAALERIKEV